MEYKLTKFSCQNCNAIVEIDIPVIPTPPDSQVARGLIEELEFVQAVLNQLRVLEGGRKAEKIDNALRSIQKTIAQAESQLASPEPENPTVARGLLNQMRSEVVAMKVSVQHQSTVTVFKEVIDRMVKYIAQAESQLVSPEPENPTVARGLLDALKKAERVISKLAYHDDEQCRDYYRIIRNTIAQAESQLAEPERCKGCKKRIVALSYYSDLCECDRADSERPCAEPDPKTLAATMNAMARVKEVLKGQIQEFSSAGKYANDYCDEWERDLQTMLDELEAI